MCTTEYSLVNKQWAHDQDINEGRSDRAALKERKVRGKGSHTAGEAVPEGT